MLRVALAQINPTVGDLAGNQKLIIDNIRRAEELSADVVAFPELALPGYPPEDLLFKQQFLKDQRKALEAIVRVTRKATAIVGFADSGRDGKLYNAAAVIYQKKIKGIYRKEALPNYGVFDEKRYFHVGVDNPIFTIGGVSVGITICEDIWVDDGAFLRQAKAGAKVLINISSSPFEMDKFNSRHALVKKRARQMKTAMCYVNLVGGQDELVFDGGSMVYSSSGKAMVVGKQFEEDLIVSDLDVPVAARRSTRQRVIPVSVAALEKKPALSKHVSQRLGRIEEIYGALVLGTRDYIRKNGFQKVLIGLSGGIDSALVAAIAVDSVGRENVVGVSMPSRYSSEGTRSDARALAQRLDIKFYEISIENIFNTYLEDLKPLFIGTDAGAAEENIQARIRGNILMALSNKFGWLVLTTGNKSEIAVGYCTLYGDMSGGFAVIKDVPKTLVYELARYRNGLGSEVIPQTVLERAPSAELRPNQTDQDSLPPYEQLDALLAGYVEKHASFSTLAQRAPENVVRKVIRMIDVNEYKRRQAAPGVKITPRAFGKDWRLPITNKYKGF